MDDGRCIHDMQAGTCGLCQPRESRPARSRSGNPAFRRSGALQAQFHSTCSECRTDIDLGDLISRGPDGNYVHEECA